MAEEFSTNLFNGAEDNASWIFRQLAGAATLCMRVLAWTKAPPPPSAPARHFPDPFCFVQIRGNFIQKVNGYHQPWPISTRKLHCPFEAGFCIGCGVDLSLLVVTQLSMVCPDILCLSRDSDSFGSKYLQESSGLPPNFSTPWSFRRMIAVII